MKADMIVKNANVFTVDEKNPTASCFVINDGKFVYVGDKAGLADYEGEVKDLGGRFVMPGMIDSHDHISVSLTMCQFKYPMIDKRGKKATLEDIAEKVRADAGQKAHFFMVRELFLEGETIHKDDLDAITTDEGIFIFEAEPHSGWCNSKMLEILGLDDNTVDPAPGFSYLVRDEDGKLTGRIYEGLSSEASLSNTDLLSDEYIRSEIKRLDAYCKKMGITALTECAMPACPEFGERVYRIIADMDRAGEISVDINGSYGSMLPKYIPTVIDELKRYNKEFNTEHLHVHTLKLWIDGTSAISTACMLEPRFDNGLKGGKLCDMETLKKLLIECDANNFDAHLHVIGDGAIRMCLDAVEAAKNELGRDLNTRVTLAHNELCSDSDIPRYKELGVIANFTPWWMAPPAVSGGYDHMQEALGERFRYEYRVKDIWDTGAVVNFGCDQVGMSENFDNWSPFQSIEVGALRKYLPKTTNSELVGVTEFGLNPDQAISVEQLIKGYTLGGAYQLRQEDERGSIEVGKNADFVVLPEDITAREVEGISQIVPDEVYFKGVQTNA